MFKKMAEFGPDSGGRVKVLSLNGTLACKLTVISTNSGYLNSLTSVFVLNDTFRLDVAHFISCANLAGA